MSKTVGIVGGSITGNKGAEAMVTTVIRLLGNRVGGLRFVIFTPYPKADRPLAGRYPNTTVADSSPAGLVLKALPGGLMGRLLRPLASAFRTTRLLSSCDLLVDVAGISFSDGREKYLPFNILTILPAMLLKIDVVKMSQAMGPFRNRANRFFARRLLRRCRYLVARGADTTRNLESIGLTGAVECPDLAFALNDAEDMHSLDVRLESYVQFGTASRRLVGISPSSVLQKNCQLGQRAYLDIHAEFVRHLTDRGYRVLLVPHSIRPGSRKLKNNDLPAIGGIRDRLGKTPEVMAVTEDLDAISLRKLIGRCDLFLASRFHSMIAALAMEVPVMVCGWGHKYAEILDEFGLRQHAFDHQRLSTERLVETFDRLAGAEQEVRDAIRSSLPAVMDRARVQIDAIAAMLEQ